MSRICRSLIVSCFILAASSGAQTTAPIVNGGFPLVSPSAPRILFESNRTGKNQLWLISADGTGERQLTNRDTGVDGAEWTADGKSILYSVLVRDTSWVYELWPDSSRERPITAYPGRSPHFSPTRDQVLYDVVPWTASHLVVADANGRSPRQVTGDSITVWSGAWSPNGRLIAFTVSRPSGLSVWVMNADGSRPHQVTHLTPEEGRAQVPAWHPDSHQLAFQSNAASPKGKSTLWIVDLSTTGAMELGPHRSVYLDETPSWFSDGQRLAFQSNRTGRMEIWTIKADGTDLRQLTGRH